MALMDYSEPNKVLWGGERPAHRGTQIIADNSVDAAGTAVVYTVTYTMFYLCGYSAYCWGTALSIVTFLEIYDDVPAVWKTIMRGAHGVSQGNLLSKSYWPPLEIPKDYSIRVRSTAANHGIWACIDGWGE